MILIICGGGGLAEFCSMGHCKDIKASFAVLCFIGGSVSCARGQMQAGPAIPSMVPELASHGGAQGIEEEGIAAPLWLATGIGVSDIGFAYDASINLMYGRFIYGAGAWGSSSKQLFSMFGYDPWKNFGSYNLTMSRVISGDDVAAMVSVGAGVSWSSMTYRTPIPGTGGFLSAPDLRPTTNRMIGLPMLIRVSVPSCSRVGFDMTMRGDLNGERSTIAFLVGMRFGRIRCAGVSLQ